jgi:hypothetical protein
VKSHLGSSESLQHAFSDTSGRLHSPDAVDAVLNGPVQVTESETSADGRAVLEVTAGHGSA